MALTNTNRLAAVAALVLYAQCLITQAFVVQPLMKPPPSLRGTRSTSSTSLARPWQAPQTTATTSLNMVSYESLMEKIPSKSVIEAVEATPNGKVIASDVAASAGVSLSQARKDLTALASLTRGDIAVSNDGELIYSFPDNLNSVLSSNSAKYKALATFEKNIWPKLFYGIRVGFGVALLASLLAIYSTIFFLQSSGSSDDNRRRDDRGFDGGMRMGYGNPFWGPSPFDFFYYRPYYGYYGGPGQPVRDPEEMGFLESTFSYIFGDGNPNQGLEERRLSLVANLIRDNKGAVTAEQLAPFCDDAPPPSNGREETTYVDESFVLPIVTQLNGEPQVTEEGDIIYVFPELQTSASSSKRYSPAVTSSLVLKRAGLSPDASAREIKQLLQLNGISTRGALEKKDLVAVLEKALPPMTEEEEYELLESDPTLLQEREYKFSLASDFQRFLAAGLGVLNLGGALYLGNLFSQYAMYGVKLPSYFGVVQSLYPFLLTYAVLFNVIPLVRSFWVNRQNDQIRKRNKIRRSWKTALESGIGRIGRKLRAATRMGKNVKRLGVADAEIVYDTKKPMEETEKKKAKEALDEFDRMLENEEWA